MDEEYDKLNKERDKLYTKLHKILTTKTQKRWLLELIDTEIELEKFSNQ